MHINSEHTELPFYTDIPLDLQEYVREQLLPQYDNFDAAHQRDHAIVVIRESMKLAELYKVNTAMVYAVAACHDLGLCKGREHHHEVSAQIILLDKNLRIWFSQEEIETMADAAEDHRASSSHEPRSIYGRIVAEADRQIDVDVTLRRAIQYGISHYPTLSKAQHFERMSAHLQEKYAEGGYLRLWIPESDNAKNLNKLRSVLANQSLLHDYFEHIYSEEIQRTSLIHQSDENRQKTCQ